MGPWVGWGGGKSLRETSEIPQGPVSSPISGVFVTFARYRLRGPYGLGNALQCYGTWTRDTGGDMGEMWPKTPPKASYIIHRWPKPCLKRLCPRQRPPIQLRENDVKQRRRQFGSLLDFCLLFAFSLVFIMDNF